MTEGYQQSSRACDEENFQYISEKIDELEDICRKITDHELQKCSDKVEAYEMAQAMVFSKGLLLTKKLLNTPQLVSLFVNRVTIYPNKVHIRFNFAP